MRFNLLYAMPGYEKQDVRHIYRYGGSAPKGEHMELEAVHMIPKR